jgi:pilus assembly protein Flp/PilA
MQIDLHNFRCCDRITTGVETLNTFLTEVDLKRRFLELLSDESGATAIEYGLIAAGIALAIIAVVNGLGTTLNAQFTSINGSLK